MFYTSFGHSKISAYLSTQVSQELGYNVDLKIVDMALSPSHLDATIMINDTLKTEIKGFWSPLGASYDIQYHISAEKIVFKKVSFEDSLDIHGTFDGTKDDFVVTGKGDALEGKVDFSLHHDKKFERDVIVNLDKVSSAKLFLLLEKKPLIAGKLSLDASVEKFGEYEKRGKVSCAIHRGGVYLRNINDTYGVRLPDDFMLAAQANLQLNDGKHTFDAKIDSSVVDVDIKDASIIDVNHKIQGLYSVDINELSKIKIVGVKRFAGAFSAQGEFAYHDGLKVDGKSHSLDGEIRYYYGQGKLEASLKKASLAKLFYAMRYPAIMIGEIEGKVDYDTADKIALININAKNARFQKSSVTKRIYAASGVDFSREIFNDTYFASSVENGIVSYDFKAENKNGYITLFNTKMDSVKNTIESDFDLKMQGEELSGEIYGSLKSPKVKPNIGKYLEFKARKEIDDFFGTGTSDKVKDKLKDVDVEDVKGFLKGFF